VKVAGRLRFRTGGNAPPLICGKGAAIRPKDRQNP